MKYKYLLTFVQNGEGHQDVFEGTDQVGLLDLASRTMEFYHSLLGW